MFHLSIFCDPSINHDITTEHYIEYHLTFSDLRFLDDTKVRSDDQEPERNGNSWLTTMKCMMGDKKCTYQSRSKNPYLPLW